MSNPPLIDIFRGPVKENIHRGAYAIVDANGSLVISRGDIEKPILPRSSYKLLQAVPLVETGAATAFGLQPKELALACASHTAEPDHVETVVAWLRRIELCERDLECGPQEPRDVKARDALIIARGKPSALHNNCSGKHTGFLTLVRHLDQDPVKYTQPTHPVQVMIRQTIADICCVRAKEMDSAIDGCSAPNFALPLRNLAHGMARCGWPGALDPERGMAARKLAQAIADCPHFVGGTGRPDTQIVRATQGRAIIKVGADGVYAGFVPSLGFGIALKIDDGSERAATSAMCEILVRLKVIEEDHPVLTEHHKPDIKSRAGQIVGVLTPAEDAFDFTLE